MARLELDQHVYFRADYSTVRPQRARATLSRLPNPLIRQHRLRAEIRIVCTNDAMRVDVPGMDGRIGHGCMMTAAMQVVRKKWGQSRAASFAVGAQTRVRPGSMIERVE